MCTLCCDFFGGRWGGERNASGELAAEAGCLGELGTMKIRRMLKWGAWGLVGLVLIGYSAILLLYRASEAQVLYQAVAGLGPPPAGLELTYERVELTTADGVRLVSVLVTAPTQPAPWLLYFHGSGNHALGAPNAGRLAQFQSMGLNVLSVDYRGFGDSEGEPHESGLYLDAEAGYDYLVSDRGVPPDDIVIYGWSLGSGVAVELATRVDAAGLILEGAFKSAPAVAQEIVPWLLPTLVSRERFDSVDKIGEIEVPILFVHAVDDGAIPIEHGRTLFELATARKRFLEISGGHELGPLQDQETFRAGVERFLAEVLAG